ncbi:mechanosensitive ion channel domain-containing protein [Geminicoccus flavidas]|uniref:mechanosensitive ion channel domain-containing protein n=1 Tax=Geminicoccus flavidas TaxID=2506407 RepID=UPI00135959ED|nr:mechanosensitive ion channel domain-containing protein [Geminicoccus flavidas]
MLLRAFALLLVLLAAQTSPVTAQNAPGQPAQPPAPAQATDRAGDLATIDRALQLLKNNAGRQAVIADLETLRAQLEAPPSPGNGQAAGEAPAPASPDQAGPAGNGAPAEAGTAQAPLPAVAEPAPAPAAEPAQPAEPAPSEAILTEHGLVGALSDWASDVGHELPRLALGGGSIIERFHLAGEQVHARISDPGFRDALDYFLISSIGGWVLGFGILFLVAKVPAVQRRTIVTQRSQGARLAREVLTRALFGILPLIVAAAVLLIWPVASGMSPRGRLIFLLLASPLWWGMLARQVFHHFLVFAAPARGWRLVGYAQKRMGVWISWLVGLAVFSAVLRDPNLRSSIGLATADIVSLLFDLLYNLAALMFVLRHKATIRALLIRGRLARGIDVGSMEAALVGLARRWHLIAITFLALNVIARLLGTRSQSFILQVSFSLALVIVGTMLAAWLRKRARIAEERMQQRRVTTRGAVAARMIGLLAVIGQVVLVVLVVLVAFRLWGFDLLAWLQREPGRTIVSSLSGIGFALITAWLAWIFIDSWIAGALVPTDHLGRPRPMSNRVKTLLPLLRNFVFVTLSVLTVIVVLANLGLNVAPLLAGAGVVGLAIGFGSQQLVQDVITGLFILLEDTISIGDVIDTGDRAGTVEALTIRTVRIRDGDGALHSIPFSSIKAVKNRSRDFGVYTVTVMIDHHADTQKAIDTMREVGNVLLRDPVFAPLILLPLDVWGVDEVNPDGIVLKGSIRTRPLQQWAVGRELNRRLLARFDEVGIDLAHRQYQPGAQAAPAA